MTRTAIPRRLRHVAAAVDNDYGAAAHLLHMTVHRLRRLLFFHVQPGRTEAAHIRSVADSLGYTDANQKETPAPCPSTSPNQEQLRQPSKQSSSTGSSTNSGSPAATSPTAPDVDEGTDGSPPTDPTGT